MSLKFIWPIFYCNYGICRENVWQRIGCTSAQATIDSKVRRTEERLPENPIGIRSNARIPQAGSGIRLKNTCLWVAEQWILWPLRFRCLQS
jgi:hypothetical protein